MRTSAIVLALLFALGSTVDVAVANGYDKDSPTDHDNGKGNDPGKSGKAPGHNKKLFDGGPEWLSGFVVANVAPGSGNWGGGPGNSGPGDKNGKNNQGSGGQTPPGQDDK